MRKFRATGLSYSMPAPRTGSIATKPISTRAAVTASTTSPAAGKVTSATGTPRRRASSRDRSTDTPRGSPVAASLVARMGLPKLMAARNVPVGASSATGAGGEGVAQAASMQASTSVMRGRRRFNIRRHVRSESRAGSWAFLTLLACHPLERLALHSSTGKAPECVRARLRACRPDAKAATYKLPSYGAPCWRRGKGCAGGLGRWSRGVHAALNRVHHPGASGPTRDERRGVAWLLSLDSCRRTSYKGWRPS